MNGKLSFDMFIFKIWRKGEKSLYLHLIKGGNIYSNENNKIQTKS